MGDRRFSGQLSQPGGRSFICRWPLRDQEMAGSPDDAGAQAGSEPEFVRGLREQPGCFLADGKNHPKVQLRTWICSVASGDGNGRTSPSGVIMRTKRVQLRRRRPNTAPKAASPNSNALDGSGTIV